MPQRNKIDVTFLAHPLETGPVAWSSLAWTVIYIIYEFISIFTPSLHLSNATDAAEDETSPLDIAVDIAVLVIS